MRRNLVVSALIVSILLLSACRSTSRSTSGAVSRPRSPTPTPFVSIAEKDAESWRKARYISVAAAVRRLQAHVDVPVVMPRDAQAGLPNLKGWMVDPKYLDWRKVEGIRAGEMKILRGRQILILSYGLASFDGCGDRSTSEETEILGQPALFSDSPEAPWSDVIWPVTDTGSTGRYGITGTFAANDMIRLAESMEAARIEALEIAKGC